MIETREIEKIANEVERLKQIGLHVERVILPTFICKLITTNELLEGSQAEVESLIKVDFQISESEKDVHYVVSFT